MTTFGSLGVRWGLWFFSVALYSCFLAIVGVKTVFDDWLGSLSFTCLCTFCCVCDFAKLVHAL
jgi:hypothetical protein